MSEAGVHHSPPVPWNNAPRPGPRQHRASGSSGSGTTSSPDSGTTGRGCRAEASVHEYTETADGVDDGVYTGTRTWRAGQTGRVHTGKRTRQQGERRECTRVHTLDSGQTEECTRVHGTTGRQASGPAVAIARMSRRPELQWSHDPEAVETGTGDIRGHFDFGLQWSHDPEAVETSLRPGKYRVQQLASMEPRPGGRGDKRALPAGEALLAQLQWSHDPEAVETRRRRWLISGSTCFNGATTRRPWRRLVEVQRPHER